MRDPNRIKSILQQLTSIWLSQPHLRLGQLIGNIRDGDTYYLEDQALIDKLNDFYFPPKDEK